MKIGQTNRISNIDIAVFALYLLGGVGRKVHIEDIAMKCFGMVGARFGWELSKYEKFPDKTITFYALGDARKAKNGELVKSYGGRGTGGDKYQITLQGAKWIKENNKRIADCLKMKSASVPLQKTRDIIRTIKSEPAFKKFRADGVEVLSVYDLADFLGSSFETSPTAIRQKFSEMKVKAEIAEDNDIFAFLSACEKHFKLLHHESRNRHGK